MGATAGCWRTGTEADAAYAVRVDGAHRPAPRDIIVGVGDVIRATVLPDARHGRHGVQSASSERAFFQLVVSRGRGAAVVVVVVVNWRVEYGGRGAAGKQITVVVVGLPWWATQTTLFFEAVDLMRRRDVNGETSCWCVGVVLRDIGEPSSVCRLQTSVEEMFHRRRLDRDNGRLDIQ